MENPYNPPAAELEIAPVAAREPSSWRDGPVGIGGWLLLPLLGLVVTPLRLGWSMVSDLLPVFTEGHWGVVTDPGSAAYHPLFGPYIVFEVVANVGYLALGLAALWFFLRKSARTPRLMIAWYLYGLAAIIIDHLLGQAIPAVASQTEPSQTKEMMRGVVGVAIWVPYFLKSVRVQNTFVR